MLSYSLLKNHAGILLVGFSSWLKLADNVGGAVFGAVGFWGLLGILLAFVCAAKEKFWTAVGSLLVWPIGLVGALRLAKPHSAWARRFYKDGRLKRSEARYGPAGTGDAAAGSAGSTGS